MMNNAFESIDLLSLELVTGGADQQPQQPPSAPNTDKAAGNIGVTVPTGRGAVQVGIQGNYEKTRSDYATCTREFFQHGGQADHLRAACGLPNGQP